MRWSASQDCDKIVPGMLLAAMRVNVADHFVSGRQWRQGETPDGETLDLISVFEGVGRFRRARSMKNGSDFGEVCLPFLRFLLWDVHCQLDELFDGSVGIGTALQQFGIGEDCRA